MIALDRVTKVTGEDEHIVLSSVSVVLPSDRRIAILGGPDRANSVFLQLLAGLVLPTSGRITRYSRLSFPTGFLGGFNGGLSVRHNIIHAARVYGAEIDDVVKFVREVADIGEDFDLPFGHLPRKSQAEVGTILTYAIPFDVYLVNGAISRSGGKNTPDKFSALFEMRAKTSGIIFAPRVPRFAKQYCDMGAIIHEGRFLLFDKLDEAFAALDSLGPQASRSPKHRGHDAEQEKDALDELEQT